MKRELIPLLIAGGTNNHLHLLIPLPLPLCRRRLQELKGNISRWLNQHGSIVRDMAFRVLAPRKTSGDSRSRAITEAVAFLFRPRRAGLVRWLHFICAFPKAVY